MKCVSQFNNAVLKLFYNYGHKVGKYPVPFMVGCVLVCGALAAGLAKIDPLTDMERLYTPENSQAAKDREDLWNSFPDLTGLYYDSFGLPEDIPRVSILFRSRQGGNILEKNTLQEIENFLDHISTINVTSDGKVFTHNDLCARRHNQCVMSGSFIFTPKFRTVLDAGQLTYPVSSSFQNEDLALTIGRPYLKAPGSNLPVLQGAGSLFFTLPMRTDGLGYVSKAWAIKVVDLMEGLVSNFSLPLDIAYSSSFSLNVELDKSTSGDIVFFAMTFALMISYASIVSAGGNMVSTRAFLSTGGVLATCLGIMASFGLVTLCGVQYVNMVGVMPFLLLGVGVDDMFLLMSAWSETTDNLELNVPQRVGIVFKKAGIGITITSVTNFLSFAIGSTSVFRSVRNFCIYTGVGVIMCYLANITFFGGCLAMHGKRIYSNRHTITCRQVKSRTELEAEGRGFWYALLCGGQKPEKAMEDQSACERGPSYALPRLIMMTPVRIIVILLFCANLGVAIWGCTILDEGLDLKDLVLKSSYVHNFETWHKEDFGLKLPISFVKIGPLDYRDPKTLQEMTSLIEGAQKDYWISNEIDICWLTTYAKTPFYDNSTEAAFITGLRQFLAVAPRFENDVVINNGTITSSRCHVYSNEISDSHQQAQLMVRMKDLAEDSPIVDFAYHFAFIFFEQFVLILSTTLQTVGITIAVMCVVTAFFLPHPVIVLLVMTQVLMIVTCIFGYMAIWGLTLSSITMVHLLMSAGLSVDFCAHVCTAYMVSEKRTREERAKDAIIHASGPILNGGTSSLVGILGLLFSESFIFQSFFKIMLLVVGFGVAHAVFFVPVLLSFMGPRNYVSSPDSDVSQARANGHAKVVPQAESNLDGDHHEDNSSSKEPSSLKANVQTLQENGIELHDLDDKRPDLRFENSSNIESVADINRTSYNSGIGSGYVLKPDDTPANGVGPYNPPQSDDAFPSTMDDGLHREKAEDGLNEKRENLESKSESEEINDKGIMNVPENLDDKESGQTQHQYNNDGFTGDIEHSDANSDGKGIIHKENDPNVPEDGNEQTTLDDAVMNTRM